MATAIKKDLKETVFEWEGKDRNGKIVKGEMRASGDNQVQASLRRQGHEYFYPPAGHHDEGGCATVAVI
jgi:fido (protein-threonine AMPylation protein)